MAPNTYLFDAVTQNVRVRPFTDSGSIESCTSQLELRGF